MREVFMYQFKSKLFILGLSAFLLFQTLIQNVMASNTIYLTRHAEKQSDGTSNPALTPLGNERSQNIAKLIKGKNITHIFSTNYKRTMQTAQPSADLHKLTIERYDPRKLSEFASTLKELKGTILVVGHSNTTPLFVNKIIGFDKYPAIDDHNNSNLYIITIIDDTISAVLLKINHN